MNLKKELAIAKAKLSVIEYLANRYSYYENEEGEIDAPDYCPSIEIEETAEAIKLLLKSINWDTIEIATKPTNKKGGDK